MYKDIKRIFIILTLTIIILPLNIKSVYAQTKFTVCRNLTEDSYIRSTPGGAVVKDVDGNGVLLRNPSPMEILETKIVGGTKYYKVSANYYSNNYIGWINSDWITGCKDYITDDNYANVLKNKGFSSDYILPLQKLHAMYPNWDFIANTSIDWNNSLNSEMAQIDRNLIQSTADISLRSTENGAYVNGKYKPFDNGDWYAASRQTVAFYMDPRNWLSENTVFMFEQLSFNSKTQTKDNVQNMLNGTFMSGVFNVNGNNISYVDTFLKAGNTANVSAFHLVSRTISEQGITGSGTINMNGGDGNIYHNYYNYGAGGNSKSEIIANALATAKANRWTNPELSIVGGAQKLANEYINAGQDTIYYQKFNTINGVYYHQYQQNVRVAPGEARKNYYAYYDSNLLSSKLTFKIPVYNNMPSATSLSINGNGDNTLKNLTIEGCNLNPSFNSSTTSYVCEVSNGVNSVKVSAQSASEYSSISGTGSIQLKENTTNVVITVTAANGNKKEYNVKVSKVNPTSASPSDVLSKAGLSIDGNYVTGIKLSSKRETLISNLKNTYSLTNIKYTLNNGKETNSGVVSTGDKITITINNSSKTYTVIIKGDVNGDGVISSIDYSRIKGYFLGKYKLSNEYFKAADVSKDGKITSIDYSRVKGYFLGKYNIEQ